MIRCPNCGEENPERFRLCGFCGTPLHAEPSPKREERKTVSVLFVDLVGFTARSDRADPEDVRATLRPYHERLKREIEHFGGTVEKFIGDAVMAVFGAPVAHEDDAERAVRAALRATEAIEELNDEAGLELAVRAAVATGEAVVALGARPEKGEGIVTGDVVNTASRLQSEAPVGGVVVGEGTFRATRHMIDYQELPPVAVKGKADPVLLWRAIGAHSRFGVDVEQRTQVPLVGREHELNLLKELYGRAVRETSVQLATVSGEPGVGKTRLVAEFSDYVDDLPDFVFWRQGRCLPYGEGITFWALGEIVKAHAGILESDGPQEAATKLARSVEVVDETEREWVRSRLAPLVGSGADDERVDQAEAFTAWRTYLETVASERPTVLVFEDLHWADDAMLAFVEHLVDWATGVPMLVLCTARPELYEKTPGWSGGKRNSSTISLAPLSPEETARLIAGLLDRAVLPAETQQALMERAGGNPLYAEEFVRMLTDSGFLVPGGAGWTLAEGAEVPVPDTVQALIAARLDTLSADRKALLHDAAVVGKVFWSGAVVAIGGADEAEVRDGMHELGRKELVRSARRSSVEGQAEYSFWHTLIRDVAYGQIPRAERAAKHRAAAEWIEALAGDRVTDQAELLAHHYSEALALARAAGSAEEAERLSGSALRFLVLAGDRAARLDVRRAAGYYERALDLVPPDELEHARILVKLTDARRLSATATPEESEDGFRRALEAFRRAGDSVAAGDVLRRLGPILWYRGKTREAMEANEEAVRVLESAPPGPELARAYMTAAGRLMTSGRMQECFEWSEKALALAAELDLPDVTERALEFRGSARAAQGDAGGLDDLKRAVDIVEELGMGAEASVAFVNLADFVADYLGPREGLAIYERGIEFGLRRGNEGNAMWARGETLWRLFDLGEWDRLLEVAAQVMEFDRREGGGQIGTIAKCEVARVLAFRGDVGAAQALVDDFLPRGREIGDPQVYWRTLEVAALVALLQGHLASAVDLARELVQATGADPTLSGYASPLPVRALVAAGEVDEAEAFVASASEGVPRWRCNVMMGRAAVLEARGRFEEALRTYGQALEPLRALEIRVEVGIALLGTGRCLMALGRPIDAAAPLREAREIFVSLGAAPFLAEVDERLATLTAKTS